MTRGWRVTRRTLLRLAPALATLYGAAAGAQSLSGADRGLGGTGAAPDERSGDDRGIGGTGVIGTIRRFGSIVVNDLRITFPRSVDVVIDGRKAALKDLKLGHVVRVLATSRAGHLRTRLIAATSEVAGPIEALDEGRMVVLGQHVNLPPPLKASQWRTGDFVAVSGLRRLDGVIVASLVERRPPGKVRLAGPSVLDQDGTVRIGGLPVAGLDAGHTGRRVEVAGYLDQGVLRIETIIADPFMMRGARPSRLSIEAYVAHERDGLHLGSGLSIAADDAVASVSETDRPVRAIVSAEVRQDGELRVRSLRITSNAHASHGHDTRGAGPAGAPGASPSGPAPSSVGPPGAGPFGGPNGPSLPHGSPGPFGHGGPGGISGSQGLGRGGERS